MVAGPASRSLGSNTVSVSLLLEAFWLLLSRSKLWKLHTEQFQSCRTSEQAISKHLQNTPNTTKESCRKEREMGPHSNSHPPFPWNCLFLSGIPQFINRTFPFWRHNKNITMLTASNLFFTYATEYMSLFHPESSLSCAPRQSGKSIPDTN